MSETALPSTESDTVEPLTAAFYSILYIDVLNQREKLEKITKLPTTENETQEFIQLMADTYGVIDKLVSYFDWTMNNIGNFENIPDVTEEIKNDINRMIGAPIDRTLFSDSMLYHISLQEDRGEVPVIRLLEMMYAACFVMAGALATGIACRGGLEIGIATNFPRVGLYGPALYKAYRLENDIAQYPRIVVGQDLVDYLEESIKDSRDSREAALRRVCATTCRSLISEDTDGAFILDYASDVIQDLHPFANMFFGKASEFAAKEWAKFSKNKNHKLAHRYFLLMNYLDTRLGDIEYSDEDLKSD